MQIMNSVSTHLHFTFGNRCCKTFILLHFKDLQNTENHLVHDQIVAQYGLAVCCFAKDPDHFGLYDSFTTNANLIWCANSQFSSCMQCFKIIQFPKVSLVSNPHFHPSQGFYWSHKCSWTLISSNSMQASIIQSKYSKRK